MQVRSCFNLVLLAALCGCASLPNSGPTRKQIEKSILAPSTDPIRLVEVTTGADLPVPVGMPEQALSDLAPPPTDMIGPGDILDISIYEAGVTLFSVGGATDGQASQMGINPGVQAQKLPPSRVDDNGDIVVPYAGKLHVMGHTIGEVQTMIQRALRGVSQNPQVLIALREVITNSVIVSGEVAKPGRLVLQTNHEHLSDVVALAGGYRGNARDLTLRVVRRNEDIDIRYSDLIENTTLDTRAYPGDRFMLINNPRTFSVMGASGRIDQVPFIRSSVSLAEAIASAGGTNPNLGDPAAIFLFRYVKDAQGQDMPTVYHINLMHARSYFLTQRFEMRDKDVLYFGNASANQPSKVVQLISQLFSPILTVTSAVQTVQNSNR